MSRLEVLKNSLAKKEEVLNSKFDNHFSTVAYANGQPMNDKRSGAAYFNKLDKQNDSIRSQIESIEKTKSAIDRQENKDIELENAYNKMPQYIKDLIDSGTLKQWGKFPHIMFVDGVEKARIYFDEKSGACLHKFVKDIPSKEQYAIFRDIFNEINKKQKEAKD